MWETEKEREKKSELEAVVIGLLFGRRAPHLSDLGGDGSNEILTASAALHCSLLYLFI